MVKLLIHWIAMVVALLLAGYLTNLLFPGQFSVAYTPSGIGMVFIGVLVLSLLNATLGKILKLLALPLNCLTLGLFSLVINAAVFFVAGNLGLGFKVENFLGAFLGSLLYSAISGVLGGFFEKSEKDREG